MIYPNKKLLQEKEYELSEVYDLSQHGHRKQENKPGSSLTSTQINKYAYNHVIDTSGSKEDGFDDVELSFVPKDEPIKRQESNDEKRRKELERINELLAKDLHKIRHKHHKKKHHKNLKDQLGGGNKGFRSSHSGYHASTGPQDFMRKKYKSEILHVSPK